MIRKLTRLFICFIVLLTGCVQKPKEIQTVRMLISGGHGHRPCIIEVFPDGLIEATTGGKAPGSSFYGVLNNEDWFGEDRKQKSRKLSKANREVVDNLITEVKKNCIPIDEYDPSMDDASTVNAVIDGVTYFCFYENDTIPYYNENDDLRKLAHKLVEISRVKLTQ